MVEFLRKIQDLTGTHIGCETSQSGACQVDVDGKTIKSWDMLAIEVSGSEVVTIEGMAYEAFLGGETARIKFSVESLKGLAISFKDMIKDIHGTPE